MAFSPTVHLFMQPVYISCSSTCALDLLLSRCVSVLYTSRSLSARARFVDPCKCTSTRLDSGLPLHRCLPCSRLHHAVLPVHRSVNFASLAQLHPIPPSPCYPLQSPVGFLALLTVVSFDALDDCVTAGYSLDFEW